MKHLSLPIDFTTLGVKHLNMFGILFPMSSFLLILQELENNENLVDYDEISQYLSEHISSNISPSINSKLKIQQILKIINQLGFGKFELKVISNNTIIISHKKYISTIFEKIYSIKSSYICEKIIFHTIIHSLEKNLNIKINKFKISQTTSHLNLVCSNISKLSKKVIPLKIPQTLQKNDIRNIKYSILSNPVIIKIKKERQLIIKDGILTLWKTSGIFIPLQILNNLFQLIEKQNPKSLEIIAQLQLYSAVQLQRNVFGIIDNEKIFSFLLLQTVLIGIGEAKIISKSKSKSKIEIELNCELFKKNNIYKNYKIPENNKDNKDNHNNMNMNEPKVLYEKSLANTEEPINKELEKFCIYILKGIIEFGLNVQTVFVGKNKNSSHNHYTFKIKQLGRELQKEEIRFSKRLSASIQINKFM